MCPKEMGVSYCPEMLEVQACLGLLLKDRVCCHRSGLQSCLGIPEGETLISS